MGETTYTGAAFGNTAFTVQTKTVENVPALGHRWSSPVYVWSENCSLVTATREITKSPTDTAAGAAAFVSRAFQNEAFEKQRTEEIEIPALKKLAAMKLPAMLKRIESEAFMNLASEAVIIPDGCVEIGSKAFADSPNLIYVWIPKSVTDISEDAFEGCPQAGFDYENRD